MDVDNDFVQICSICMSEITPLVETLLMECHNSTIAYHKGCLIYWQMAYPYFHCPICRIIA